MTGTRNPLYHLMDINQKQGDRQLRAGHGRSKKVKQILLMMCVPLFAAGPAFAQVAVDEASWTEDMSFKSCDADNVCTTYKKIKLDRQQIKVGEPIGITNLETGEPIAITSQETGELIATFTVQSIQWSREVKMCWLGDTAEQSKSYITVSGCKK